MTDDALDTILDYHRVSKHSFQAFASGPGHLDWANQPAPFRRYSGAVAFSLARDFEDPGPDYGRCFTAGMAPPARVDYGSISRLFRDSLALSAWKEYRGARWALRVNPSSGNLHPTEGYLVCGPIPDLCNAPMVAHYAPREHALEIRAELPVPLWRLLASGLPASAVLIGLTSIHWREAWKYGERAYRYCQHDVGHVLGALAFAAAGLGWQARLLDEPGTDELAALMGVAAPADAEPEHPDCLVAVYPRGDILAAPTLPPIPREAFGLVRWQGQPNRLSPAHDEWRWVEAAADAAVKPRTGRDDRRHPFDVRRRSSDAGELGTKLRELIHRRRSAVEMDGVSSISRDVFYRMLLRTMPWFVPLGLLPWEARVHLGLFVHRVDDLASGVYLLARDPNELDGLRGALRTDAIWEKPPECPDALPLFLLRAGDARPVARQLSCGQDIAADGCFSVAMLTAFEEPLRRHGAWCYPRLYWECGVVGQILYLEAEAAGIRGTGIGCFFDDPVHAFFGLEDEAFQSLYHFTVGGPVDDPRLTTLPPYRDGGA